MSDEQPASEQARAGRALPWKRLLVVGLGLTLLVVALVRGSGDPPEAPPAEPDRFEDELLNVPLPATPHKDRQDEARGMYVLENDRARFSLELLREGRFRFLSRLTGKDPREAHGTWNLVGNRLTMVYERINGVEPEARAEVSNLYRGSSIELLDTGLKFPVVLTKRAMIRQRNK